jgi:hypothetical protein
MARKALYIYGDDVSEDAMKSRMCTTGGRWAAPAVKIALQTLALQPENGSSAVIPSYV